MNGEDRKACKRSRSGIDRQSRQFMQAQTLTHAQRDELDTVYVEAINALPASTLENMVERGRLYRLAIVARLPHMREVFNLLPELERV